MPEPSLYGNKGTGYAGAGLSRNNPKRALLGQKTRVRNMWQGNMQCTFSKLNNFRPVHS